MVKKHKRFTYLCDTYVNSFSTTVHKVIEADSLLCFQIATDEDSGVLLYKGDNDHIAMELYRGRLRVSYDTGSYPPSAIYRYMLTRAETSNVHTVTDAAFT